MTRAHEPRTARRAGPWAGEAAVRVVGSYGSKLEAIVRRLLYVLQADPEAKARLSTLLIFRARGMGGPGRLASTSLA